MKYSVFLTVIILITGCSNSKKPPIKYMSKQSHLDIAKSDSVEYYKIERNIWNFPAQDPFTTILYFNDQNYRNITQRVSQDTSYHIYQGREEPQKAFSIYFEKHLSPALQCPMNKTMYRRDNYERNNDVVIIFCNRIYFRHSLKGPFD